MNNFIKENWFKIGILIAIILATVSVGYYFVLYLPSKDKIYKNQETLKIDQENSKNCTETGQKYFDSNFSEYKNNNPEIILSGPFFHFNKKLDACLLEYKLMIFKQMYLNNPGGDYTGTNYIINLSSGGNEAFATYFWENGKFKDDWSRTESGRFNKIETDLMNN